MIEHNEIVILGGKEYKIRCDVNVLIEIQEQFDTLNNFEMQLVGLKIVRDENGDAVLDEDKNVIIRRTEPSIKAISKILPVMLAEADKKADITEALEIIDSFGYNLIEVAAAMQKEFGKCFERKNE